MLYTTFYSYKGGVGRTLSLVNSAKILSKSGKNVFLIDMDLEAPGINSYNIFRSPKNCLGVVDYITDYLKTSKIPDIKKYFYKIKKETKQDGNIYIMPAGMQNAKYCEQLHNINWQYIYSKKDGYNFIEKLKNQIEGLNKIDYVLIDSRTGFSDISGISTHQIADVVVLVFNLNEQNIQGIIKAYNSIISVEKNIQIIIVISPFPNTSGLNEMINNKFINIKKSMSKAFNSGLDKKNNPVIINYDPLLAINDIIITNYDEVKIPLSSQFESYRKIVEYIKLCNPEEFDYILKGAYDYKKSGQYDLAERELKKIIEEYPENPKGLFEYGTILTVLSKNDEAIDYLKKAVAINQEEYEYVIFTINTLIRNNRYDEALQYVEIADKIKKNYPEHYFIRAKILSNQGKYEEANKYNEKGIIEMQSQKIIKTRYHFEALKHIVLKDKNIDWGNINKTEFLRLLEESPEMTYSSKVGLLLSINERKININTVENIFYSLMKSELELQQLLKNDYQIIIDKIKNKELNSINDEQGLLKLIKYSTSGKYIFAYFLANYYVNNNQLEKSLDYFKISIINKPTYYVYNSWANALADFGKNIISKEFEKGRKIFQDSFEKFSLAVKYKEDDADAYNNWGIAKIELWYSERDNNLLECAIKLLLKGEKIQKYSCMYNLARAYALLKDKKNALYYLTEIKKANPEIKKRDLEKDMDWVYFHDDKDFLIIIK